VNVRVRCGLSRQPKGDDHDRASAAADAGADTTAGPGPSSTADTARPVTAGPGPSALARGGGVAPGFDRTKHGHIRSDIGVLRSANCASSGLSPSQLSFTSGAARLFPGAIHLGSGGYWLGDARPPWR
jgi:hypothetical protein